jgi:hypothetical protein
MSSTEPRLPHFGTAIAWLLSKDVSSTRLATLFHTTPENIRVVAFRARHGVLVEDERELPLEQEASPELAGMVGVRQTPDEVVRTPIGTRRLEYLKDEIERVVTWHSEAYKFMDGVRSLRRLAPQIGFPADSRRVALSARLRQYSAWFLVHSGRCDSAAHEAHMARTLWKLAYHESREREYAERFIQSALIGSQAHLLSRRPQQAWELLELASDAVASIGAPEGSDNPRQRGVALFQLREDQRAAEHFQKATQAMERCGEARIPAQLLMTGARHISLLGDLKWDKSQEVLDVAVHSFGSESLEASMALNWAAACGLSTDSLSISRQALDILQTSSQPATQFGHQATIHKLLALTPDLGLDSRLRRIWVRRALYENAFRNR